MAPKIFFSNMKPTGGLMNPAIFLAGCVVVYTFFIGVGARSIPVVLKNLGFGLVFPFITSGILFFFLTRLFKATGTYEMAFRVNAYAATISLLSWVPGIGLLLEVYRLYLLSIGLSAVFHIKTFKAFLAIILTLAVFLVASAMFFDMTGGTLFAGYDTR